MLLFEIAITRLFSILFYHHFSFFAISLVMSGLVIGGLVAARWDAAGLPDATFATRLGVLSGLYSVLTIVAVLVLVGTVDLDVRSELSLGRVTAYAMLFLPGLIAAGAFLALAFARNQHWIGSLYAADLVAAALACLAAVFVLRVMAGPAVMLVVAGLAAVAMVSTAPTVRVRWVGLGLLMMCGVWVTATAGTGGALLRLRTKDATPFLERWNEHSYVRVFAEPERHNIVIDRGAATGLRHLPAPPVVDASWKGDPQHAVYRLGRTFERVAIIGVGGGRDLFPPLHHGAKHVDGYDVNRTMIDFLERDFRDYNSVAARPEVRLVHDEARHGIAHSGHRYDVIQASLIDTWAATASGGFVLSENSLYTREGWRIFLDHLTPTGVLTMTRWHLPNAPAETDRLVALAATALEDAGIRDVAAHVVLLQAYKSDGELFGWSEFGALGTILVSKSPFTAEEVQRIAADAATSGGGVIVAPGHPAARPLLQKLLVPATRAAAIAESPFNIAPPTDVQPYFFLQVRPADLVNLRRQRFGGVTEITFNGVRVLMVLGATSLALVTLVIVLTMTTLPGAVASAAARRTYRWMTLYFLGIGLGYILVQLSLLQRLMIVLGRPTLALSVVLCSMLLGTGCGAALAARLFPGGDARRALASVVIGLVVLRLGFSAVPALSQLPSIAGQLMVVAAILFTTGFLLGSAFPLGVGVVAPTGEWAVQKMWAINGAASIAASVLAAVIGLVWGSGAVLTAGIVAYVLALVAAIVTGATAPMRTGITTA